MNKMAIIPVHIYDHHFDDKEKLKFGNGICLVDGNYLISILNTPPTHFVDVLCRGLF